MTIVIVGSGPAGAFAALGALQAGAKVLMIDSGLQPEPDAQKLKAKLGATDWNDLSPDERAALRTSHNSSVSSLSNKRVFGSDFSTRSINSDAIQENGCRITQSYALGGLSNIWGRGVEPPYSGEFDHWIFKEGFIESLQVVLSHIPFSADEDNLAEVMPLYTENYTPHQITPECKELLERWDGNKTALNKTGIHFGKTRLAMRQGKRETHGCQLCNMCFYGCSYGALFDTAEIISSLSTHYPNFEYRPGLLVKSFSAHPCGDVEVKVQNIKGKGIENIRARKLILAAGPPQTTLIVMRSLGIRHAVLKNSDLIKIPFIKIFGRTWKDEEYHSLSQLTLTINNRKITKKAAVMHLFWKNPMITDAVLSFFPSRWRTTLEKTFHPFFSRFFVGMCFLHSDDSGEIHVQDDGKTTRFTGKRGGGCFSYLHPVFMVIINPY